MTGHFRHLSARPDVRGARRSSGCCAKDPNVNGPGMPEGDTATEGFEQSARRIKGRPHGSADELLAKQMNPNRNVSMPDQFLLADPGMLV